MPGNLSNYAEAKLTDHLLGTATFTKPTATHLALFTTSPSDSTAGVEVGSGNGYARVTVTWSSATTLGATNNNTITFTAAGSGGGNVVAIGLFDSINPGTGNMLAYGPLTQDRNMESGNVINYNPGDVVFKLD